MSWNKSGDERAKSYQVYKDLQSAYDDLEQRYRTLEAKVQAKDEALRQMARELYEALEAPARVLAATVHAPALPAAETATPLPVVPTVHAHGLPERQRSEVVAKPGARNMSELLDAVGLKRKEG